MKRMQTLVLFIFGIAAVGVLAGARADSVAKKAQGSGCQALIGSCDYYLCREVDQNCGVEGYHLKFAYPYCTYFLNDLRHKVGPNEAAWLGRVSQCLRDEVEKIPNTASCSMTQETAISSHVNCYVSTGFCALPFAFKLELLSKTYQELKDQRMRQTFFSILGKCGKTTEGDSITPII